MKKNIGLTYLLLLLAFTFLLAGCSNSSNSDSNLAVSKDLPSGWSSTSAGMAYDGSERECFYIAEDTLANQNFQYVTDVSFADEERGIAALVFQSSEDSKDCYVAKVDARTNKASLYKMEHGLEMALGVDSKVENKADYHLQVNMIGTHIDFFVDNILVCGTGDYVVSPDLGQGDAFLSGRLGLLGGTGAATFQNTSYQVYDEGASPVLTELAVAPQGGTAEREGNMLANSWYVYQQYVSSDCEKAELRLQTAEGVDTSVFCTDTGAAVDGAVTLNPGQNHFQILTSVPDEEGNPVYQLSYRLNILRRGEDYYQEPYRGLYHYSVKEGWANDPNGLVKLGDTYHMYYQFYPEGTDWGAMHWAHAVSTDLVHWEEKGVVLYPNEYGTMFSGCAVADEDNVSGLFDSSGGIIAYITANGNGQRIIAAYSQDGDNWTYYRGTDESGVPNGDDVLIDWFDDELLNQAFRDPKVFKYQDTYFMVIAGGKLRIYSSTTLLDWKLESSYGEQPHNSSSMTVETECPDLYRLPIEGEDGWKWVLSYGGRRYQVGDFTQVDGKWEFIADEDYAEPAVMNFGNDSYAAMTYYIAPSFNEDTQERVIAYNWMNSWDYCTVVDDFSGNDRFNGTFNLNLELSLTRDKDGKLVLKQTPIEEYGEYVFPAENIAVDTSMAVSTGETVALDGFSGDSYRMDVVITPESGATQAGALVRVGSENSLSVSYDFTTDTLVINRGGANSPFSSNSFSQAVTEKREDGSVTLHIYVDKCSLEAFSGDYTAAGAMLVFPGAEDTGAALFAEGGACRFDVTVTQANSTWNN